MTLLVSVLAVSVVAAPRLLAGSSDGRDLLPATTVSASPTPTGMSIEGTWVTPTISRRTVKDTLRAHGLLTYAPKVLDDQSYPTAWTWKLRDGTYSVTSTEGVRIDVGQFSVAPAGALLSPENRVLTLKPYCDCTVVFTVLLTANTMKLTLASDTSPDYLGVPDQAFQRAIFTTGTFTRLGP